MQMLASAFCLLSFGTAWPDVELEKKRKAYTFWRQFNEKTIIIPGCPGSLELRSALFNSKTSISEMSSL